MSKAVIIMVGVPGCGKSTWVKEFLRDEIESSLGQYSAVVCSADDGHMYDDGCGGTVYVFKPERAPMAHSDCTNKYLRALGDPTVTHVIVDNTNISAWERQNYIEAAKLAGADIVYQVWLCETIADVKLCARRNSHNVPAGVIADMAMRFELPELAGALVYHHTIRG